MPEMIHYTVSETREVGVWANDSIGAAQVATKAFEEQEEGRREPVQVKDVPGNITIPVKITNMTIQRDR